MFQLFLVLSLFNFAFAEELFLDKSVNSGKLDNGLVYYIKTNPNSKTTAIRLVLKVGRDLESEKEAGFAELLKRVLFPGQLDADVEDDHTIALLSGDINGALSRIFNYSFSDEVLTSEKEQLINSLQASQDARLDFKCENLEISHNLALGYSFWLDFFKQEMVSKAIKALKEASPQAIKAFYQKWYKPQRAALIITGIEAGKILSMIDLPSKKSDLSSLVKKEEDEVIINCDKKVADFAFIVWKKREYLVKKSSQDLRKELLDKLIIQVLKLRLSSVAEKKECLLFFNSIQKGFRGAIGICKYNDAQDALKAVFEELQRFEEEPLNLREFLIAEEELYSNIFFGSSQKIKNSQYVKKYVHNFLYGDVYLPIEEEIDLKLKLLEEINLKELNAHLSSFINDRVWRIFVNCSHTTIDKDQILKILNNIKNKRSFVCQ